MSRPYVKNNNRRAVLDVIRQSEDLTVGSISHRTQLSKPTVKTIIDFYLSNGLVTAAGKGSSTDGGGKRPTLFRFNKEYGFVISLHVGPDFIFSALSNMDSDILFSRQIPIGRFDSALVIELLVDAARDYISNPWTRGKHLISIEIGLPGIVDSKRGISVFSPHYPDWGRDLPFVSIFRDQLGTSCPIHIDCVNRYQAFAEQTEGVGRGTENLIIVDAMEVGLGAGVIVDGRLKHGINNLSGEIGHMVLQVDGPICNCGGRGCFEALVRVDNVVEILKKGFAGHEDSIVYQQGSQPITIDNLFTAAAQGDPFADEVLDYIATWFAIGLNNIIMVNDPKMIVIQGVYTGAGARFLNTLKNKIDNLSLPGLRRGVELEYSTLGEDRCILGQACFGIWDFFQSDDVYETAIATGLSNQEIEKVG